MTTAHIAFLVYGLTLTALIFLNLAITIYIAHRKIDHIESFLLNCEMIMDEKNSWAHAGLLGKVIRLTNISLILLSPKIYTKRKLLDIDEINNLPSKIKTPLIAIGLAYIISFFALIGLGIFMHYLPPLTN